MTGTPFTITIYLLCLMVTCETSEICLERNNITFTIPCGFDICDIPGDFCDKSDPESYRCGKCDKNVCNNGPNTPPECKLQCLDSLQRNKVIHTSTTFWNKDRCQVFFAIMVVSVVINFIILIYSISNRLRSNRVSENITSQNNGSVTMTIQPTGRTDSHLTEEKTMAISNRLDNTSLPV